MEQQSQKGLIAFVFAAGVSAWLLWLRRRRRLPPGSPWSLPLLGESLTYVRDPLGFIEAKLSQYGGTCRSNLLFAPTVILAVTDANAKLLYSERDMAWPAHFQKLIGKTSLPMVNDPLHKKIRTLSSRAFGDRQLDTYLPCLQRLSAKHLELWAGKGQTSRELHMEIKKYAFECGEAVILGVENDRIKSDRFMELYEETFKGLGYVLPFDIPGFPFHKCMLARKLLVQEFQKLIEKKRKQLKDPCRMFQVNTMLDTMLLAEEMNNEEELSDFCVAMMFAGHDTTLASIQSCLHWLKQCPDVECRLREEVREAWDGECRLTRRILDSIPQTRAFLQEVWRITPPAQVVTREVSKDTEIDGYVVPKGWTLLFAPAGRHSKAEDSRSFSIQRHLRDGKFFDCTFDPLYFATFGGGSRMCIGYKFARDEMLIFLLHFLHGYDVQLASSKLQRFPFNLWRVQGTIHRAEG